MKGSQMDDELLWKRRFLIFMAVRLFGLATILLGVAITYTDLARAGGWPALGAIVIVIGLLDAVLAPMLLKRMWNKQ